MEKPVPQRSDSGHSESAELQARQVNALMALYKATAQQQELLEQMLVQQKAQTEWLISIAENAFPEAERFPGRQSVKVNDINMPFWALVGFMLKVAFASIPAAIIFSIVLTVIGSSILSTLIGILSAL